jgi:hypothetical protein
MALAVVGSTLAESKDSVRCRHIRIMVRGSQRQVLVGHLGAKGR